VLVIACAGVVGWLLILTTTLSLGAAAKRGDEFVGDTQRYAPPYCIGVANVISLRPDQAGIDDPPGRPVGWGASCSIRRIHDRP
jgi:hypothetical protein